MKHWLEELVKFDYEALDNPEFTEDSVREELMLASFWGIQGMWKMSWH